MGFTSENDAVFTFHLREGHRWSDGSPFTADDFDTGGKMSFSTRI
jgi:peptide/nickel transport system substrate-binding protein